MSYKLNSIDIERTIRLEALKNGGEGAKYSFLKCLKEKFEGDEYQKVVCAYDFAVNIDYDHVGLSSDAYLLHPLRVAEMVMGLCASVDIDSVVIALLHNVLEVGSVELEELKDKFGVQVSDSIRLLTVDRKQQWDQKYKEGYYRRINDGYKGMKIVKVIDKLDNIFMLGLNPDSYIRSTYLEEINRYIIPIAESELPNLVDYIKKLSKDAKQVGYFSNV
jgi:(p)ppGpp synthase/HD superfamily hydrolase